MHNKGIFRPNFIDMYPNEMLPLKAASDHCNVNGSGESRLSLMISTWHHDKYVLDPIMSKFTAIFFRSQKEI